jgi:hypothetical protein
VNIHCARNTDLQNTLFLACDVMSSDEVNSLIITKGPFVLPASNVYQNKCIQVLNLVVSFS